MAERSPEYLDEHKLAEIARKGASSLRDTTLWLHRRVEHITYTDGLMIRRRCSVDFSIPKGLPPFYDPNEPEEQGGPQGTSSPHATSAPEQLKTYFVPVALLQKWPPLMSFDLRDEQGRPIPLLTTDKNREVDAEALVGLAPEGTERDCLEDQMRQVALRDADGARRALETIGDWLEPKMGGLRSPEQRQWARALRVAGSLVGNCILWARVEAHPGSRHIVKFSYDDLAPRDLLFLRRLRSAFSWAALRVYYEIPNMGERGSYHLEIEAPPELAIFGAKLTVSELPPLTGPGSSDAVSMPSLTPREIARGIKRAATARWRELFASSKPGASPPLKHHEVQPGNSFERVAGDRAYLYRVGSSDEYGIASVRMGVGNRVLITSAMRASMVISLLMLVFFLARRSVVFHVEGAVALLVIFPALLALIVVRPGEHPLLQRHISGVRFLMLGSAALPVADAVVLLSYSHPTPGRLKWWFLAFLIMAAMISCGLVLSWLLPVADDPELTS